ncbi:hypothetical protein CCR95_18520 [Thiocystis minor]|uniref:DUF2878 family protein n=1 Tax=Thiocystis minor TaxID=61597 RepID=UPI00191439CA|nr:hypothetical protein [Thiocystis minor]
MTRIITNLIAFQIGWFACVLGGANRLPWVGVGVVALVAGLHLSQSRHPRRESALLLTIGLLGAVWDSLLVRFGFLDYPSGMLLPWLAPVWIIAMWIAFATTLNVSLGWLKDRWFLATVLGAVGGPLAYYAGHKLGGVQFPDLFVGMAVLAGGWSFLMPLSAWIAKKIDDVDWSEPGPSEASNLDGEYRHV